jgi:hypothetical protein
MSGFTDRDTWEQKPRFKLRKIGVDGPYHIPIEAFDDPLLPILNEGFLSLELTEGSSFDEAQALLDALAEKVAFVTYTGEVHTEWVPGRRGLKINKND